MIAAPTRIHRWLVTAMGAAALAGCASFTGPLAVSENGRYLTWHDATPFYYVADTPWQLLASLDLPETREYIDLRAEQGFTALQLVATPWSFDDAAARWDFEGEQGQARVNADGEVPFFDADGAVPRETGDVRFDKPNDAYWRHVDAVLDYLGKQGHGRLFHSAVGEQFQSLVLGSSALRHRQKPRDAPIGSKGTSSGYSAATKHA